MKIHPLIPVIGLAVLATLASLGLLRVDATRAGPRPTGKQRIVSLAPAITDTLFAIGAGSEVIGVSDYCDAPPAVKDLPRLGSGLTPQYERIAELSPTLIVSEQFGAPRGRELTAIAPTRLFPWLGLQEILESTRALGRVTGHEDRAHALALELQTRLDVSPPKDAPRVLLVLGYEPGKLSEIWFIRRNSLHGAALHAAGGRNAVDRDVHGLPRMGLERLLEIDPDAILVLVARPTPEQDVLSAWRALAPLTAVRRARISVIDAPEAYANGPRIFLLVERLTAQLKRLFPVVSARAGGKP